MPDTSRFSLPQIALCVVGLAVVVVLGLGRLGGDGEPVTKSAPIAISEESGSDARVVVHVAGAVRRPGVYKLSARARVDDAVARAGGPSRRADLGGLNLAAKLEDGRQVLVPERAPRGSVPEATATGPTEGQPLNLNTATLEQLDLLSGIGPLTAEKILAEREERGGFATLEELGEIPGIGDMRLATLREEATL